LAFLIDSIFTKPEHASKLFASFTTPVWLLLVALCVCLAGSIVSALLCLWSRLYPPWRISSVLESEGVRRGDAQTYPQEYLGFFQFVGHFQHDQYRERLKTLDHEVELAILAFQLVEVSKNVTRKHLLVDCGFLFAGLSLFFFLLAGSLYVWIL
jgi:hypothetical protein